MDEDTLAFNRVEDVEGIAEGTAEELLSSVLLLFPTNVAFRCG